MPHNTLVVPINAQRPELDKIARAAEVLRTGGLVALPTETVYGLGAQALDAEAVGRIFTAKGRPANNPLIVHVADTAAARALTTAWPNAAHRLAERFWPGPLSMVLPKAAHVPPAVTAGASTVALRVPAHPVALALIRAVRLPIAAPSANRSNQVSPTRAEHVLKGLAGRIDLVLDAGPTPGGLESTVIDLSVDPPRLLRPGLVAPAEIEAILGPISRQFGDTTAQTALPSPGMLSRHYAPRATLECCVNGGKDRVQQLLAEGFRVGWLAISERYCAMPGVEFLLMPGDPVGFSSQLYVALHGMDEAGVDRIVVELPPATDAWLAVRDRLRRAASP